MSTVPKLQLDFTASAPRPFTLSVTVGCMFLQENIYLWTPKEVSSAHCRDECFCTYSFQDNLAFFP